MFILNRGFFIDICSKIKEIDLKFFINAGSGIRTHEGF